MVRPTRRPDNPTKVGVLKNDPTDGLSERERQLIALVVDGRDTRQVAERLSISRHTVQAHFKSVFGKF